LQELASRRTTAGALLQFDDSQVNAVPEDPMLRLNAEPLQEMQYVPPPVAPLQEEHVPIEPVTATAQQVRRCAWYPLCDRLSADCGGWTRNSCRRAKNGEVILPATEEQQKEFEKKRKSVLAADKQQQRQQKKAKAATVSAVI